MTMTNQEKYKTAKEREVAFLKFCNAQGCASCPLCDNDEDDCRYLWLELAAPATRNAKEVADILARYNAWRKDSNVSYPETYKEITGIIDQAIDILRNVNG